MEKSVVERGRRQMAIWRMRNACWIPMATNTHTQVDSTRCFSTATSVGRMRLDVKLNAHLRSCKTLLSGSHFEQSRFYTEMNAVRIRKTN